MFTQMTVNHESNAVAESLNLPLADRWSGFRSAGLLVGRLVDRPYLPAR